MRMGWAAIPAAVFLLAVPAWAAEDAQPELAAPEDAASRAIAPLESGAAAAPPPLPAERRPVLPGDNSLWRVRPALGVSTMRLGGLEHFADATMGRITGNWARIYGIAPGPVERRGIDFALVESIEAAFQVDPLVSVAAKVSTLRSQRGSLTVVSQAGATRLEDSWEFSTEMIMVTAGAGFNMPLAKRTRLNICLFVGAGFATVNIGHRYRGSLPGVSAVDESTAEGTATVFVPEFTMEIERDLSESLAIGAGLGYRFGGIETFRSRYATSLNMFSASPEIAEGGPIRNSERALLNSDYGGLILVLFLTARG